MGACYRGRGNRQGRSSVGTCVSMIPMAKKSAALATLGPSVDKIMAATNGVVVLCCACATNIASIEG